MGFIEDVGIREPLQSLVAEMNCIVASLLQPVDDSLIDTHVR